MTAHRFRFYRTAGFDQVLLDRPEDLVALDDLDPRLWVALACPVEGLEFDEKTLRLIDADGDGRIRLPDVRAALRWALGVLRDPQELVDGGDRLALAGVNPDHPDGATILAAAAQILGEMERENASTISLADVTDTAAIYARLRFNGDGVIPPESAEDEATAQAIAAIVETMGGVEDRCGKQGVDRARVEAFFEAATTWETWWKRAEAEAETLLPLGEATADAAKILQELGPKVDDFFTRSRLAAFDPRAEGPLNRSEEEYQAVAAGLLSPAGEEVASFPLARVVPGGTLPLHEGINPAWSERIAALRTQVIEPLLGPRDALSLDDWRAVQERFAPWETWSVDRGGEVVAGLGIERVRELLSSGARETILELVAQDEARAPEMEGIALVEKLLRYKRDLRRLLRNFVSFAEFYSEREAIFRAGTLFIDRRRCDLCVRVADVEAHAAVATRSHAFLIYCTCVRKSDGKTMNIVAAVTDGPGADLVVGRNGIFYDRTGADWDARVVKVVEHPISVREAFWTPWRRIGKLVGDQIERFAAARDKAVQERAATGVQGAAEGVGTQAPAEAAPPTAKEQAFDVARFAGIFAAIGLAIGAIGSTLAVVASGFLELAWWQMPLAIGGLALAVSGPSMLLAWLKLRKRALGPLLDANGWAVNSRVMLNIPFGEALTQPAKLPRGAQRVTRDPWAPARPVFSTALLLLVLVGLIAYSVWAGHAERWMGALLP